jgi:hypothetical protein
MYNIPILEEFENGVGRIALGRLSMLNQFVCKTHRPSSSLHTIRAKDITSLACTVTRLGLVEGLDPFQTLLDPLYHSISQ